MSEQLKLDLYPNMVAKHIWEIQPGLFTYSDETENFSDDAFSTVEAAQKALEEYVRWLG